MDPIRSCIVCRKKNNKNDLFRIISKDKKAYYDIKQSVNSRGIYICKNIDCINKLRKNITKEKFSTKLLFDNDSILRVLLDLEDELGD